MLLFPQWKPAMPRGKGKLSAFLHRGLLVLQLCLRRCLALVHAALTRRVLYPGLSSCAVFILWVCFKVYPGDSVLLLQFAPWVNFVIVWAR